MSALGTELMGKGEIADIRWSEPSDQFWLRHHAPAEFVADIRELPPSFRRAMSVYRCVECGAFGVLEGIGEETLLFWSMKRQRCNPCMGCDCEGCQAERAGRET